MQRSAAMSSRLALDVAVQVSQTCFLMLALVAAPGCNTILGFESEYHIEAGVGAGGDSGADVLDSDAGGGAGAGGSGAGGFAGSGGVGGTGGHSCDASWADCDGVTENGCETDLSSTSAHCGACDHDCLSGSCDQARCMPFELSVGQDSPLRIAVDDSHLYWTNQGGQGAVMRLDLQGGEEEQVAVSNHPPGGFALDDEAVYWSEYASQGSVWRLAKADIGTAVPPTELASSQATSISAAVDSDYVYWVTPGTVRRVPKTGGSVENLANGQSTPFGLVVDLGQVYWTTVTGGEIKTRNILEPDAGALVLAAGQDYPVGLDIDLSNLYWSNSQGDADGGTPKILRLARTNMVEPVVVVDGLEGPGPIVAFGPELYWTDNVGGTVMSVPKTGGMPRVLAEGQGAPTGIAVTPAVVYWVNRDDGRVMGVVRE